MSCIERDLEHTFSALNAITNPRREDILRFLWDIVNAGGGNNNLVDWVTMKYTRQTS